VTKYVLDNYDGPRLDYSTLGFTADTGDILDATGAPDARWSVNANQAAAETVTRYVIGGTSDYVEPTDGHVLTYSDAENTYVPQAPATFLDGPVASRINDPASLTAGALSATLASKWRASTAYVTGDVCQAPDGTTIRRNTNGTSGASFELATPVLAAPTTATTGGTIAAGTTYFYKATALNALGETIGSTEVSRAIAAALTTPVNAAFTTATTGGTLAAGTYSYRVSATNAAGETLASTATTQTVAAALAAPVLAAPTTATTGGTLAAATYYYKATAINAVGETIGSNEVSIATTGTTSTVGLSWAAITGATGYKIYRATVAGGESTSPALVETLGAVTTYTDTGTAVSAGAVPATNTTATTTNTVTVNWGAVAGATGYKVYGRTDAGELLMASVGAVTTWTDTGAVTPAGALPASNTTATNTNTVGLSWAAITGATGYKIYRATATGGQSTSPALVASVGAVTTYTDTGTAVTAGAVPATGTTSEKADWTAIAAVAGTMEQVALSATYGPSAAGSTQRLMAGLTADLEDQALMLMGDSRGNERTEWFGLLVDYLAAEFPAYTVLWNLWNDGTQGWDAAVTVQTGTGTHTLNVWNASVGGKALDYPAGDRLKAWATKQPTVAILALDTNEATGSTSWDQQRDRVLAITEQFLLHSPTTDWILIAGPQDFTESNAASMYERGKRTRQAAKVKGYGFVDVYQAFVDYGPTYGTDLYFQESGGTVVLHPNAAGSQLWADTVKPSFRYDPKTQPAAQPISSLAEAAQNLFPDGDLRGFDGTTLKGWTVPAGVGVSKDTTHFETKGYGVRFLSSTADVSAYRDIPVTKYQGQWVTVCARVFVPTGQGVDVGRPLLNDFTSSTNGLAYPAAQGSFVWQTVSKKIADAATLLRVTMHTGVAVGGDLTLDRIVVVPGILPRDLPTDAPTTRDVQVFAANATWTKPTGAKLVHVSIVSGGGGGASGRRGADGTNRYGGGGAGGASRRDAFLRADALTSTVDVTVGAAGVGGAAVTTDDTNGNDGTNGGVSTFGAYLRSTGGTKGIGGTAALGTNGAGGLGVEEGANGGAGGSGAGASGLTARGAGGGGGGGGIGTGNLANAGGVGGYSLGAGYWNNATGGVIDSTPPGVGYSQPDDTGLAGNGGGGGASSITTAAQAGANGGKYGGGGGGGGASKNGSASGKGGDGAPGLVVVTTYF